MASLFAMLKPVKKQKYNMSIESSSAQLSKPAEPSLTQTRWTSFKLYNGYRILIGVMLLLGYTTFKNGLLPSQDFLSLTTIAYLAFGLIAGVFTWLEKPRLEITLPIQIIIDIGFILLLMYGLTTSHSSVGLLLVISIAAAGLISEGKLALFYAAIAAIGILFGQFVRSFYNTPSADSYSSAAMLSVACFAIAWLAHSLAKRMQQSEELASQRGLDLENLAQVNALIADKMEDGVLVVDQNFRVQYHNIQAEAFLNVESGEVLDKSLDEISPDIAQLFSDWIKQGHRKQPSLTPTITKVNIAARELRISFLPVAENDPENTQGAVVFLEDWSHMQTQSHQVKLAALGRLTANIAHEIRNPLSAIGHANQLMQEDEEVTPSNQRMLQIISDNVLRLDQIIKNVLELNRRDRTNQELVDLENFISEFYHQFCAVENISNEAFTLSIKNADISILFDRRHLNQIVWNLCKNGWRHSQKGDNSLKLEIYLSNRSSIVNLEVTNDGEPIPENVSTNLFEPFFTTEETGTGLGLYIGRELAEANGASLQHKPSKDGTKFIMLIKRATI